MPTSINSVWFICFFFLYLIFKGRREERNVLDELLDHHDDDEFDVELNKGDKKSRSKCCACVWVGSDFLKFLFKFFRFRLQKSKSWKKCRL